MKFDHEFVLSDGSTLRFDRLERLEDWLKSELETWQWMNDISPHGSNLYGNVSSSIRSNLQIIEQLKGSPENKNIADNLRQNLNRLNDQINAGQFIPSRTDIGKFILKLAQESPESAVDVFRVSSIRRPNNVPNDFGAGVGLVLYTIYEHGIGKFSLQSSKRAVSELFGKLEQTHDTFEIDSSERIAELDNMIVERKKKVEKSTRSLATILGRYKSKTRKEQFDLRQEAKNNLDEFQTSVKERISAFEEFYETKVALLEPVNYWRAKKRWHIFGTFLFGFVFLTYSVLVAFVIGSFVTTFDGGALGFLEYWRGADFSALGAIALLLALILIFARILYRIFASQMHLWNDASERVTMTQTYLAFAEKGHVKDEHLGAILNRLFAPASDGVVKDEFGSAGPLDAVMGRFSR